MRYTTDDDEAISTWPLTARDAGWRVGSSPIGSRSGTDQTMRPAKRYVWYLSQGMTAEEHEPGPGPVAWLAEGRALPSDIADGLFALLGFEVSRDGLARLFQPSFPGVRGFIIAPRVAPDRAVEITLVGLARDGHPVWSGSRAFVLGRDGSLELHRGLDRIEPTIQHRNLTVSMLQRELELLRLTSRGPSSRLTVDAEGLGRYLCALHGFVFADETDEGPPVRSNRPFAPEGDRARLIAAAEAFIEEVGRRRGLGRLAIEGTQERARRVRIPWDLVQLTFVGAPPEPVDGADGEAGATVFGRDFLLDSATPSWRAALYLHPRDRKTRELGDAYRHAKTRRARECLEAEYRSIRAALDSPHRPSVIQALELLGMIGGADHLPYVEHVVTSPDRRIAGVAKRVARMLAGTDLVHRMKTFAFDPRKDPQWRGLILRVLAEHYPEEIERQSSLLRVDPDARIQRAVVPVVASAAQGTAEMAAMLAANPADEKRPGLQDLRLELIERLAKAADPMTLPVLLQQYRRAGEDPKEALALSRALVAFADPRARSVLSETMRSMERPLLP